MNLKKVPSKMLNNIGPFKRRILRIAVDRRENGHGKAKIRRGVPKNKI